MASPKILVFAGSIRTGAWSGKLAAAAAKEFAREGADVTLLSLADYPMPIYNGDDEKEAGVPENAKKLARQIGAHQGVFVSTPEYNNSLPALLKNSIDWVSRINDDEIRYKHRVYALGSSSPGPSGGVRALMELRPVLANGLGAILIPNKVEVPHAGKAFDEAGNIVAERPKAGLAAVAKHLIKYADRLAD